MKENLNMEHIDIRKPLTQEEFCGLFEHAPLTEKERERVKESYWGIYNVCLEHSDVTPRDAWLAARNTFITKEPQFVERMQKQKENQK